MPPYGRQCALECDYVRRLAKLDATRMDAEYDATPLDLPPGKSEVATRLDLHCRPLCGKSFGAQCGQHLRPRTEAVRWSSTRVCMIDELTATLTATRSTISPSTKIITHNLPPNRNHGGPSRTLRMDLRIRSFGQCQWHIAGPSDASSRFRMCHLAKRCLLIGPIRRAAMEGDESRH